jgi:SAM-dependent methyltransferase
MTNSGHSRYALASFIFFFSFALSSQPLHKAVSEEAINKLRELLSSGYHDVNDGHNGETPLDLAHRLYDASSEEHPIIKLLKDAGGRRTSEQERDVLARLCQSIKPKDSFWMGDRWDRGLLEYSSCFQGLLCKELIQIGREGRILDAGCGNAYVAMDLHSCRLNPDNDISMSLNFRYWPGKRPIRSCEGRELSPAEYQEDQAFLDNFKSQLSSVRSNAPHYIGVTTKPLPETLVRRNIDVFLQPVVRVLTGRFFSEIPNKELSGQEADQFDIVLSIFGVFPYSKTLEADVYKMLSLLKVGGKLFLKSDASNDISERMICYTNGHRTTFWHWFSAGLGIKLVHCHDGEKSLNLVIEKTAEVVVLPKLECEESYTDERIHQTWVGPRYTFLDPKT